jgi:uncharacterized C2H2 Zn-finger protein
MKEMLQCPLCSAKIRRQNQTSRQFVDRFVSHINHYHGHLVKEAEEDKTFEEKLERAYLKSKDISP